MSAPVIPGPGSLPLPASPEVLAGMHLAASFVFAVLAGVSVGWPVLTIVAEAFGAGRGDTSLRRVAVWMARRTPGALILAVVFYLPVLLLGVVRHGDAFLPAAQQMGWFWLAVGPLFFFGCGAAFWVALRRRGTEPSTMRPFLPDVVESYILAFRRRGVERPGLVLTAVATAALLAIGFVICAQAILVVNPSLWLPGAPEPSGTVLPLRDPQMLPRMLHAFLGTLALAGFTVAWHGAGRGAGGDYAYGRTAFRFGIVWLAVPVAVQAPTALWFLYSLPAAATGEFVGGSALPTAVFWAGISAQGAVLLLAAGAMVAAAPRASLLAAGGGLLVTAASTVSVHHMVREMLVDAPLAIVPATVNVQPGVIALFAGAALAATAIMVYLIIATSGSGRSGG